MTLHYWELFIILFTIRWCHHSLFISCTQTSTYFSHITIHNESRTRDLIREIMKRSFQFRIHRSLILLGCLLFLQKTMAEEYTVECQQDRIVISFDQQYLQGLGDKFLISAKAFCPYSMGHSWSPSGDSKLSTGSNSKA